MRIRASFISVPVAFNHSCRMASRRASVSVGKADLILNKVSGAPGFWIDNVVAMAGVPDHAGVAR